MLTAWYLLRVVGRGDGASMTPPVVQIVSVHGSKAEAHDYMSKVRQTVGEWLEQPFPNGVANKIPHYYRVVNAGVNATNGELTSSALYSD